MKTKLILIAFLATCFVTQAQILQVSGNQTGVWNADTVLVVGDVTVEDSVVVMPGTVVLFDGFYAIDVAKGASFKAQGTSADSIVFTVADTTGFHHYDSGLGGWNGFKLEKAGRFLLDYCVLEYGKAVDTLDPFGGVVDVFKSDEVSVLHSTFHHNTAFKRGGAVNGVGSRVEMRACSFHHNTVFDTIDYYVYGGAASFLECDVALREMDFHDNKGHCVGGALSFDSCSVVLDRSVFIRNKGVNGGGLYLMRSFEKECKLSNLLFDDNFSEHFGGGFAVSDASPEISNVLVINNESHGVSCNGVFFYQECSPVLKNCIIYGNYPSPENPQLDTTQMWAWTFEGFGPEFYHCLVEGGTKYFHSWESIVAFENILDADPMFVDAENHDFRLMPDSPCIDAGDETTPSSVLNGLDLDGHPRVIGQRVDMGPYEFGYDGIPQHSSVSEARLIGNPLGVQSRVEWEAPLEGTVTVSVFSMAGRCVASKVLHLEGTRSLELGGLVDRLAPGVYLIEVVDKNGVYTLKAVR